MGSICKIAASYAIGRLDERRALLDQLKNPCEEMVDAAARASFEAEYEWFGKSRSLSWDAMSVGVRQMDRFRARSALNAIALALESDSTKGEGT